MKSFLICFCLFWLSISLSYGQDSQVSSLGEKVGNVMVRGRPVPVYQVAEIEANSTSDGIQGFAIQVAYWLHQWTAVHAVEAIANLCHTPHGKEWGARVLTVYAHTSSPITNACPNGMVLSTWAIHSHPQGTRYRANAVDKLFLRQELRDNPIIGTQPDDFSVADFQAGHGYMVGATGLHLNDGKWHATQIWNMNKPDPYPTPNITLSQN